MAIVRIGTRGSPLALAQAHMVRDRLMAAHALTDAHFAIVIIKTSGDRIQDRPLSEVGGKGLFTKELEDALLAGEIDLAVHSMKDVATVLPDALTISTILAREDVRDAFISLKHTSIDALPLGAIVGTSSLRRQAQVKARRPDLQVIGFRGNVETRLRRLAEGQADATFLAVAGLNRLGLATHITAAIDSATMIPAVAQGAIGIEIRKADLKMASLLEPLDHDQTHTAVRCERAFLARLDGSCRTPIAGFARIEAQTIHFTGEILLPDGSVRHGVACTGPVTDAARIGDEAARDLLARAGPNFLRGH